MTVKEDDLILCTVKAIEGTTVSVEFEGGKGSITLSEVSAGRIRNIREYINVGKKVVCKVLRARGDHIELSLRRVTTKEKEAVLERHTKERALRAILFPILKEKTDETLAKIAEEHDISEFLDKARDDPKIIAKYVPKEHLENIAKILSEKREKEKEIKKSLTARSMSETGLYDLQEALKTDKADIRYIGSSKFTITVKDKEFKTANAKMNALLEELRERAKKHKVILDIKE